MRSDEHLISQAFRGNRLAAQELVERHRKMAFQVALGALGNADDANDVAQEALLYGIQRLSELRDRTKFAAWIRTVTLSRCSGYRRRRATRRLGETFAVLNERIEGSDYAESLALRQALSNISEPLRITLLLHYEGGYSVSEVARLLDVPANTVRSRLMAAKQRLRADLRLDLQTQELMPTRTFDLTLDQRSLIESTFPGSKILSLQKEIEPWMPFTHRVHLAQADGSEKSFDFRYDITPNKAELLTVLAELGIPCPRLIHGPVRTSGGWISLTEPPIGENLLQWALGGTPHRIRLATERAFQAIHKLHEVTPLLLETPVGKKLPCRTLNDELEIIANDELWNADPWLAEEGKSRRAWLLDPWFSQALLKIKAAAADIDDPLVYTDYSFFLPLSYRIEPSTRAFNEPLGAPGDPYFAENQLSEFVQPFGHFGDPLLGLAMVWVYDCYPFVHTGFVEQFLWRAAKSQRDFAPRLGIKALQMVARDLPVERPTEPRCWDSLRGWVEQALSWL